MKVTGNVWTRYAINWIWNIVGITEKLPGKFGKIKMEFSNNFKAHCFI
jgi:hypothetical protein